MNQRSLERQRLQHTFIVSAHHSKPVCFPTSLPPWLETLQRQYGLCSYSPRRHSTRRFPAVEIGARVLCSTPSSPIEEIHTELTNQGVRLPPLLPDSYRMPANLDALPLEIQRALTERFLHEADQEGLKGLSVKGTMILCAYAWSSIFLSILASQSERFKDPTIPFFFLFTGALAVSCELVREDTVYEAAHWLSSGKVTDPECQARLARYILDQSGKNLGGWIASKTAADVLFSVKASGLTLGAATVSHLDMAAREHKRRKSLLTQLAQSIRTLAKKMRLMAEWLSSLGDETLSSVMTSVRLQFCILRCWAIINFASSSGGMPTSSVRIAPSSEDQNDSSFETADAAQDGKGEKAKHRC